LADLKNYAIGTLTIMLLISLGINVDINDTHICRSMNLTKYCDRLSSTGNTCYPFPETRLGSKYCSEGWEEINKEIENIKVTGKIHCNNKGCF